MEEMQLLLKTPAETRERLRWGAEGGWNVRVWEYPGLSPSRASLLPVPPISQSDKLVSKGGWEM